MRTVATNVYNYFELSEEAKEKAFNNFCYEGDYPFHSDNEKSIMELEDLMDVTLRGWEYDMYNFHFNVYIDDEDLECMYGQELKEYLISNFDVYMDGKKDITGYYLDCIFFDKMKKTLEDIEDNHIITYRDVIYKCFIAMFEAICDDIQDYYSIGHFEDLNEINGWEYLENGELY